MYVALNLSLPTYSFNSLTTQPADIASEENTRSMVAAAVPMTSAKQQAHSPKASAMNVSKLSSGRQAYDSSLHTQACAKNKRSRSVNVIGFYSYRPVQYEHCCVVRDAVPERYSGSPGSSSK